MTESAPITPPAPEKKAGGPSTGISWGRILAWTFLLGLLAIVAVGLMRRQQGAVVLGSQVPDFSVTSFEGQTYRLSELRGKVVVLNFWASWCKPCEQEAADLEAAWRYYEPRGDVIFLGLAWTDTEPASLDYIRRFDITYPNGPDLATRISQLFRTTGVPETYIIDKNGLLANRKISPYTSLAEIKSMIDPLLEP